MNKLLLILLSCFIVCRAKSQVIINEIQSDAGNKENAGGEWIELKNISSGAIDISCWRITNGGSYKLSIPNGLIVPAGGYVLIADASSVMCSTCDFPSLNNQFTLNSDGFGAGTAAYANTIFLNTDVLSAGGCECMDGTGALSNGGLTGDRLVMYDNSGNIMDAVMYSGGNNYGTGALSVNFNGTLSCPPLPSITVPDVTDAIYSGRTICNDLTGCNSSYARLPDGNNGATVSWNNDGNLACSGCTNPCTSGATNTASTDIPTPGLNNSATSWNASLNGTTITSTNTNITVCGATPLTFEYTIENFVNVALTATQSTGNLGSYVKIGSSSPSNFTTATYNPSTGITNLSRTVIPGAGVTVYDFVWGDANTNCTSCPGSSSTSVPNDATTTMKECYVFRRVTVTREEPLGGSPTASCSIPGAVSVAGATGTNIKYTLQKQTTVGGSFTTIAGPQNSSSFAGIIDDDADPALPNYQILVSTVNTVCVNPTPLVVAVPNSCLGNPACPMYVTSGAGAPTFTPASGSVVCAGSPVQFSVEVNGICSSSQVEVMYDFDPAFDPYFTGTSLGIVNTTVGTTPPTTIATSKVFINEFVPRPQQGTCSGTPNGLNPNSGEWVELYNAGTTVVDLSGWILSDGDWTATIPAGTFLNGGGYFLIGGGGTLCSSGIAPDLNLETCNCATVSPSTADIMNLTDGNEQIALYDCSGTYIDGVLWNGGQGLPDITANVAPAAGCGNYLTQKNVNLPAAAAFTNTGGSLSGGTNQGRYRTATNTWVTTTTTSGTITPRAANPGGNWTGTSVSFGTQCPPPPVNAIISVNLPDTCVQTGNTSVTLKAIYRPDPVAPCLNADVTAAATYTIPPCTLLTLSGSNEYCTPAVAPLSVASSNTLVGNYDITLSNGINTSTISAATGAGPFSTNVTTGGTWTITSVTAPAGTCNPRKTGEAVVTIHPIPAITSSPASVFECYLYGYDLTQANSLITTSPPVSSFVWYDNPTSTTPITTFVNPSGTTTYYVAPSTGNPANCEGAKVPMTLTIDPLPLVPSVSCNGTNITFTPQTPDCTPTPCASGLQYSLDGILWTNASTYTVADPGWAGWGASSSGDLVYIRNTASPDCFISVTYLSPCAAPLPIQLQYFTASPVGGNRVLTRWMTTSEINASHFDIERSADGIHYKKVGQVKAVGNSSIQNQYSFVDENPLFGSSYYRLKSVDDDTKFFYSPAVKVDLLATSIQITELYPNPAFNELQVGVASGKKEVATLEVIDMLGKKIYTMQKQFEKGYNIINIPVSGLAKGTYTLRLVSTSGQISTERFTKQ